MRIEFGKLTSMELVKHYKPSQKRWMTNMTRDSINLQISMLFQAVSLNVENE